METTKIGWGFKGKNQAAWFSVWREYYVDGLIVYVEVIFEIWPAYFKRRWLNQ
jgi:hypothetical protein